MSKTLHDLVTRQQVLLEGLKTKLAADFTAALDAVGKGIGEVLGALKAEKVNDLNQAKLKGLLGELRGAQQEVFGQAADSLTADLAALSEYVVGSEYRMLTALAKTAEANPFAQAAADGVWKTTIKQPISATGQLLEPFVQGWGEKTMAGVDSAVLKAWGEGQTIQQLSQAIRGTKARGYKDGLIEASRRQGDAIARTATQHVAQQARMGTWEANSDIVEGWEFLATLDGRTTDVCRHHDGEKYKLGEGPQPPIHVNCRSTSLPVLPEEFDWLDEGATRFSSDGDTDAKETYYSWLKRQPEGFQDEVLGVSRAKLLRDGGLTAEQFKALQLDKNFKPLTLAEMQLKEPLAFKKAGVDARAVDKEALEKKLKAEAEAKAKAEAAKKAAEEKAKAERKAKKAAEEKAKAERKAKKAAPSTAAVNVRAKLAKVMEGYSPKKLAAVKKFGKTTISVVNTGAEARAINEARLDAHLALSLPKELRSTTLVDLLTEATLEKKGFKYTKHTAVDAADFLSRITRKKYIDKLKDMGVAFQEGREFHMLGTVYLNNSSTASVWAHEIAHALECSNSELDDAARAFLRKRTTGEALKPLSSTGKWYNASEVFWEDSWKKKGGSHYMGKSYAAAHSEIISMGVERLMFNPIEFMENDPEYFDFMINLLQGDPT